MASEINEYVFGKSASVVAVSNDRENSIEPALKLIPQPTFITYTENHSSLKTNFHTLNRRVTTKQQSLVNSYLIVKGFTDAVRWFASCDT